MYWLTVDASRITSPIAARKRPASTWVPTASKPPSTPSRTAWSAAGVAEQDRRPDDGVEDDVVLALKVRVQRVLGLPPVAPRIGLAADRSPFEARGQVADHRVEPDVDALVLILGVARDGNAHAPV